MDVASLIVRIGADVSSLEAGLSRANTLVEANAGKMKQAGAAAAESGTAATAAQDKFNAALARTQAQLQALKGDSLGSLKTSFPSVSDADLSKMATLKSEIGGVKAQLLEEAGAAKEAEKAIAAAGKEGVAAMQLQRKALKEAEAEWASFAKSVEKSSAAGNKALAKEAQAKKGPGAYGAITSAPVQGLADAGLMAGGVVAGLGGLAVKQAGDFDTAMHDMQASARVSAAEFKAWHDGILALSKDPNVTDGPTKLAKAMYEIASLGYKGKDALDILGHSARLATGGLADVEKTVHMLDAVMKSGIGGFNSVSEASNILARSVHMGAVHVEQLAESFPRLAPLAKSAGISLQDLLAVYIGLTRHGMEAGHAQEVMGQILNAIMKPSRQARGILDELGVSYGITGVRATGLAGVMQQMSVAAKGHADQLVYALGRIQGMQGVLASTDKDGKEWKETLEGLKAAQHGMGAELESATEQMKGFGGQSKKVQADIERIGVEIGEKLLPHVKAAMGAIDRFLGEWDKLSPAKQGAILHGVEYTAFFVLIGSGAAKALEVVGKLAAGIKTLAAAPVLARIGAGPLAAGAATAAFAYTNYDQITSSNQSREDLQKRIKSGDLTPEQADAIYRKGVIERTQANPISRYANQFGQMFGRGIPESQSPEDIDLLGKMKAEWARRHPATSAAAWGKTYGPMDVPGKRADGPVPPGVHPADGSGGPSKEFLKEQKAAMGETLKLEQELKALHGGHAKAVGDLAAKYHLLPKPMRDHLQALKDSIKAYSEHEQAVAKHAATVKKEGEKYQSAVEDARGQLSDLAGGGTERSEAMGKLAREFPDLTQAQQEYLQGLRDSVKAKKEDAQTLKTLDNEVEASRGKLLQQQAAAAAGGRVWDVHAMALEKTHKAYESLTAPMRAAIDELAKTGQQGDSANALEKMSSEFRKASAELQALRTGDSVGLLRAENLGVDDATLGKMDAYRQQLLGIKNATEAIKAKTAPIIDPASKNALEAVKRYAGTGNLEKQQAQGEANQLNQIAKMLNQYTAGSGGGADAAQRLNFLKQGGLPPELLATLQKTVGNLDAFFGGVEKQSAQAADEIVKANQANTAAAMAYLAATKDWGAGLVRNLSAMDAMVSDIHAAAMAALQSGGGVSGHRAMGGPVSSGRSYIVGERGPEIFTPGAGGNIAPNSAMGGGGTNIVMHVHTADAASFRRSGSQLMTDMHRASEYHRGRNG